MKNYKNKYLEIENEIKTMRWWRKEKKNQLLENMPSNHGRMTQCDRIQCAGSIQQDFKKT